MHCDLLRGHHFANISLNIFADLIYNLFKLGYFLFFLIFNVQIVEVVSWLNFIGDLYFSFIEFFFIFKVANCGSLVKSIHSIEGKPIDIGSSEFFLQISNRESFRKGKVFLSLKWNDRPWFCSLYFFIIPVTKFTKCDLIIVFINKDYWFLCIFILLKMRMTRVNKKISFRRTELTDDGFVYVDVFRVNLYLHPSYN